MLCTTWIISFLIIFVISSLIQTYRSDYNKFLQNEIINTSFLIGEYLCPQSGVNEIKFLLRLCLRLIRCHVAIWESLLINPASTIFCSTSRDKIETWSWWWRAHRMRLSSYRCHAIRWVLREFCVLYSGHSQREVSVGAARGMQLIWTNNASAPLHANGEIFYWLIAFLFCSLYFLHTHILHRDSASVPTCFWIDVTLFVSYNSSLQVCILFITC